MLNLADEISPSLMPDLDCELTVDDAAFLRACGIAYFRRPGGEMLKTPLLNLGTQAARAGVSTSTFRVSQAEADQIRQAEREGGEQAALAVILKILRNRHNQGQAK